MSLPHHTGMKGAWLRMLSLLPFPNRTLKYFPPSFTLRDPVLSLVHRERAGKSPIALLLFHMEDYYKIRSSAEPPFATLLQRNMQSVFTDLLSEYTNTSDIIGVKQYRSEDIALFVRLNSPEAFSRCSSLGGLLREELENRLQKLLSLHTDISVRFRNGCALLEGHPQTELVVETAYHHALTTSTKKLPENFNLHHLQLEELIRNEKISVLTQPIMNLKSGEVYGWEVLSRGPVDTPLHNPAELFEFADQAGLLPELEWLVIRKAFQEISERGIQEQVFINITPVSLREPKLLPRLLDQLNKNKIPSKQIIFEITERHSIEDFEQMAGIIRSYRAQGFRFAVDDAGAGYSSLQSISELIPDIIKIDKSVIRNIDRESVKQALLRSLLYFAENINCQVIAEGVEREEEANVLFMNSVHMGQGYYFAKPQPHDQGKNPVYFADLKEKIIQMRSKVHAV